MGGLFGAANKKADDVVSFAVHVRGPSDGTFTIIDTATGMPVPPNGAGHAECTNKPVTNAGGGLLVGSCGSRFDSAGVKRVKARFTPTGSSANNYNSADSEVLEFTLDAGRNKTVDLTLPVSNGALVAAVGGSNVADNSEVAFGSAVVFTATPDDGYYVSAWTGSCVSANNEGEAGAVARPDEDGVAKTCTKAANRNLMVGVTFSPVPVDRFAVVFIQPTNGVLSARSGGVALNSGDQVDEGATVTFRAEGDRGCGGRHQVACSSFHIPLYYVLRWNGVSCQPESVGTATDSAAKECEVVASANLNVNVDFGDFNECQAGVGRCHADATCINEEPGRSCECNSGYDGNGFNCTDINECDIRNGDCGDGAVCHNEPGTHRCESCGDGFMPSGSQCVNVNECTDGTHTCGSNAACTDTVGSFTCECNNGYQTGSGGTVQNPMCEDIDECAAGTHSCNSAAQCTNTVGGHTCADNIQCGDNGTRDPQTNTCDCDDGWTGTHCEVDVDECSDGTHTCGGNACTNADPPQRFICAPDIDCGTNGTRDPATNTCDCNSGWTGTTCRDDINECETDNGGCDENATCTNAATSGDPAVCTCNNGYTGDGRSCADINECDTNNGGCDENASCSNAPTPGDPAICECNNGYTGTGQTCTPDPDDECSPNPCGDDTVCNDPNPVAASTGDYVCSCKSGFSGAATTGGPASCANIDECDLQTDNCHDDAVCTDTVGSFSCNCKDGFSGDGVSSCDAIPDDECNPNPCGADTVCDDPNPVATNTGDYVCSCGDGFSGTTTTGSPATCADVDECATGTDTCGDAEKCRNTAGSFACEGLPEVWIVAPAGEMFRADPESGCEIRKWTESCDGRDAALSDCTPDGEGMVTVGVVFDCGN